jgi:hypothetical protein
MVNLGGDLGIAKAPPQRQLMVAYSRRKEHEP